MSSSLEKALLIVLCIDAVLLAGQIAVTAINPSTPLNIFHNVNNTLIADYNAGNWNNMVLNQNNSIGSLPLSVNPVSADTGSSTFTDTASSVIQWLSEVPGLNILFKLLGAPIVYMMAIGLPIEFTFIFGAVWFIFTSFLIFKLVTGRD